MKKNYKNMKFLTFVVMWLVGFSLTAQEVVNTSFGPGGGEFTVEFDVVPSHSPMNGGVGLSDGDVGTWADMSAIIGFHNVDGVGLLRAYNSTGYEKMNDIPYTPGMALHISMSVNVDAQTYSVDVTPDGGVSTNLATDYGFRKAVTELNIYASYNDTNVDFGGVPGATMDVTNFVYTGVFVPKSADIIKAETSPVIDGDLSDWDSYEANAIDYDANNAGSSASDFSGYWKATWNDSMLFLMAEINDDTLWNEGSAFWNHDALNFFIGVNEKNGMGASNDPYKNMYNYWWAPGDFETLGSVDTNSEAQATAVKKWDKTDGSGYAIEWSISFEALKFAGYEIDFVEGTSFLLDVTAVDDDDEIDNYNVWGWSFDGSSWTNMDNVGTVTLAVTPPIVTPSANIEKSDTPPSIDGDLADWADVPEYALSMQTQGAGSGGSDFEGYWKAVWTDDELIMMAEIKEDSLYNEGSAFWNHDAVNFYIGLNERNGMGVSDPHKTLFHYWWAPGDDNFIGGITDPADVQKWDTDDGYAIEWKIRFDSLDAGDLGITFGEGTSFLFDVVAVDDDDEIDDYTVWSWAPGGGGNFGNMDLAGQVTMAVPAIVTPEANIAKSSTPPAIDGDLADWADVPENALGTRTQGAGSGGSDFEGYWKAVWTDDELIMMAEIKEDSLYNEGSAFWNHDAVNFYIGLNERNGMGSSNDVHKWLFHYWWAPGDANSIGGITDPADVKKWDTDDGYAIEWKVRFDSLNTNDFDITFEEGTSFLFDVAAVDDDDEIDDYTVWSWAPGGGGSFANMDLAGQVTLVGETFSPNSATINQTNTPPAIDGNIDDWAEIPANDILFDANGIGYDADDFSGYWKATWTNDELYMMADITDDALWNEGSPFWNHDAVNFYIGLNERNGLGASNDDNKYLFNYWWGPGESTSIGGIADGAEVSKWDKADGSGYVIEWKVRFDSLNAFDYDIIFEKGTEILFDVVAVDDDDEVDNYVVWGWSSDGRSFTDMDNTGDLIFGDLVSVRDFENNHFNVYPNPVKSAMTINGFTNVSRVEMFNLQGQKVLTKQISNTDTEVILDINNFHSGAYVLRMVGENNYTATIVVKE